MAVLCDIKERFIRRAIINIHTVVDGDDLKLIMKQGLVIFK